jgi:hypothetical protein
MEQPIKIDLGREGIRSDESITSDWAPLETENRCHSVLKESTTAEIADATVVVFSHDN